MPSRLIVQHSQSQLPEVILTGGPSSRFAGHLNSWQQQAHQDRDDGNHDQQLHQSKSCVLSVRPRSHAQARRFRVIPAVAVRLTVEKKSCLQCHSPNCLRFKHNAPSRSQHRDSRLQERAVLPFFPETLVSKSRFTLGNAHTCPSGYRWLSGLGHRLAAKYKCGSSRIWLAHEVLYATRIPVRHRLPRFINGARHRRKSRDSSVQGPIQNLKLCRSTRLKMSIYPTTVLKPTLVRVVIIESRFPTLEAISCVGHCETKSCSQSLRYCLRPWGS